MTQELPLTKFWIYLIQCVRILWWSYLKPYTFANWLLEIHPELKPADNPFKLKADFSNNPRLQNYANQVWCVTALIPILAALLLGLVYEVLPVNGFNWTHTCFFWMGWLLGLWFARSDNQRLEKWFEFSFGILFIFVVVILLLGLTPYSLITLLVTNQWFPAIWGVFLGTAWGVSLGWEWGMKWARVLGILLFLAILLGVEWSSTWIFVASWLVIWCIAWIVVSGVASGVALGVTAGTALSLVSCLALADAPDQRIIMIWGGVFLLVPIIVWIAELLCMSALFVFSRGGKASYWIGYLPSRFDEKIIFPLPFMVEMIMDTYKENTEIANTTIKYLTTSTNQQKVAFKANLQIALYTLNQCQTIEDIANTANKEEVAWIHSNSSKHIEWTLRRLLDIAKDVHQYFEIPSDYLRYKLLEKNVISLEEVFHNISLVSEPQIATYIGKIAQSWREILQSKKDLLKDSAKASQEIRQVYIPGNALDPNIAKSRFKGRVDLFHEIEASTSQEQAPVLLLYGGRRSGKTSTLKYLPVKLSANLLPLRVDIQGAASATTLSGFAEFLVEEIIEGTRRLRQSIDLPELNLDKLAQDPFPILQKWFRKIENKFPEKRFLLCFDEYECLDQLVKSTNSYAPLNFIRHILQDYNNWILLFCGSHLLDELPIYWSNYLINAHAIRITYLKELEAKELITKPIPDFPDIYEEDAVNRILHLTRCQPYLVQLVCYEIVELLNKDIRKNGRDAEISKANQEDVEKVIPIVLERGDLYFRYSWTSLNDKEQRSLQNLVQGKPLKISDKSVINSLVRKEILEVDKITIKNQDEIPPVSFQVPLVQKYVEKMVSEEI
ncbi:hypothetical protein [Mastigocoleus testarum]|uniref:ATP-binding protein n=1 Tax=Mastigocoleus testarum BC008 TaxID=371196 RepID=A0A0V7ZL78_9CYAN|nr:hypothetical protein [Mastigocoleus testarum]KST62796.1 hypothetical protein BC008_10745 [Mastigocoleus testarum BC008]KST65111.1 hypothetical protein BC008_20125 [Mastigocoleus testarum BC008]